MQLISHLAFNGQAETAMTFYTKALDGRFVGPIHRNPDNPSRIMHCQASFDHFSLMASDTQNSLANPEQTHVDLHLFFDSLEKAQQTFATFETVGQVNIPFQSQFWGSYFGRIIDQWGITWSFSYQPPQN